MKKKKKKKTIGRVNRNTYSVKLPNNFRAERLSGKLRENAGRERASPHLKTTHAAA